LEGTSESAAILKRCYYAQEIDSSSEGGLNPEAGPHDSAAGTETASLKRKYMVGRVALRTLFFDTHLLDAVTAGPPAAIKQACFLRHPIHAWEACAAVLLHAGVTPPPHASPKGLAYVNCLQNMQVVLLGAGMDTRAWRLPLPEGEATDHA
jgi:hypothetical protein